MARLGGLINDGVPKLRSNITERSPLMLSQVTGLSRIKIGRFRTARWVSTSTCHRV